MQPVSLTAQWTAAIRSLEGGRGESALFVDDMASELAKPAGFELLDRYRGGGVQDFVAIRTRFFDDVCTDNAQTEVPITQICVVAAGMDTRPYRLSWPAGAVVYELDHKRLLNEKQKRLTAMDSAPKVARIGVPVDFSRPWAGSLKASGFDENQKTLWIAEGLLFFLTEHQVGELLLTLRRMSGPGSRLAVDMTSAALLRSPFSRPFLDKLRNDGVPWLFGSDDPEAFLLERGWKVSILKEPGESGAGSERWPYPLKPRGTAGVARNWLIVADCI
jgi:methyltransferase (TIGR00027 family)